MRAAMWLAGVLLAGCTAYVPAPQADLSRAGGAVHTVAAGETLWSISRAYKVELDDLLRENRISDAARVKVGQRITIPSKRSVSAIGSRALANEDFIWPVEGKVTSLFGMRQGGVRNKGIDIQARQGADVLAARAGEVSFTHEGMPGFGKTIILDHGGGVMTVYAYVDEILVRIGESVSQRQVIARVGKNARTGVACLHFEVRRNQKPHNPFYYLP